MTKYITLVNFGLVNRKIAPAGQPWRERERERERERPLVESLMVTTEGREFNASPISLPPTTLLSYPIGTGWLSGNGHAIQGRI
jgi:hypothetical protein